MTFKCTARKQSPRGGYGMLQGTIEDDHSLLDSSLTSLSWLQNLKVPDLVSAAVASVPLPVSPNSEEGDCEDTNSSFSKSPEPERYQSRDSKVGIALSPIRKCLLQSTEFKKAPKRYRTDPEKPPFAYSTLIYLAIRLSKTDKVTLNEIYRWIKENFKYFRIAEPGWQNSIRHNLSLNELFVKVPRSHGKGNYWKINPDYEQILSEGGSNLSVEHSFSKLQATKLKSSRGRKRAHSQSCCHTVKGGDFRKRVKSQGGVNQQPADPCGLPGDLNWVSLLSSQKVTNCGLCPSQNCRPAFGSPILGTPDLGHIGEPVMCSPLVIPTTLAMEPVVDIPSTPLLGDYKGALLEEVVLKQDSPSPQLLPWAESRSQSPVISFSQPHPWSESKETTQHEMKNLCPPTVSYLSSKSTMWSPDSSWSSSSTYSSTGRIIATQAPRMSEAVIY